MGNVGRLAVSFAIFVVLVFVAMKVIKKVAPNAAA